MKVKVKVRAEFECGGGDGGKTLQVQRWGRHFWFLLCNTTSLLSVLTPSSRFMNHRREILQV